MTYEVRITKNGKTSVLKTTSTKRSAEKEVNWLVKRRRPLVADGKPPVWKNPRIAKS